MICVRNLITYKSPVTLAYDVFTLTKISAITVWLNVISWILANMSAWETAAGIELLTNEREKLVLRLSEQKVVEACVWVAVPSWCPVWTKKRSIANQLWNIRVDRKKGDKKEERERERKEAGEKTNFAIHQQSYALKDDINNQRFWRTGSTKMRAPSFLNKAGNSQNSRKTRLPFFRLNKHAWENCYTEAIPCTTHKKGTTQDYTITTMEVTVQLGKR